MPAGLQVFGPDGSIYTEVTDRLTSLVSEGTVSLSPGQSIFVSWQGMVDSAEWFVAVTMGNIGVPQSNGFTIYQVGQTAGACRYSVFRR